MQKVVITDCDLGPCDLEREVLKGIAELTVYQIRTEDDVIRAAKDADGTIVQYAPITRRVIESLGKCKVVSRYGIGFDCIDVKAATDHRIYVANVTDYCIDEVSDHTITLLLASARKIVALDRHVKNGAWNVKLAAPIFNLNKKTLGLAGYGKIGQKVSQKAAVFGLKVIAFDPYISPELMKRNNVEPAGFEMILRESDFVSLHVPLTKDTHHMISRKELTMMKNSSFLINTSRGPLIDEKALGAALKENWIAGAAIDVVEEEPLDPGSELLKLENLIITPHAAYYSVSSLQELQRKAALEVARVLQGGVPISLVNRELLEKKP